VDDAHIAWGRASSPLVVDGRVIVPVGGAEPQRFHSLAAFDALSGARIWTGGNRQAAYASPSLVTLDGQEQILIVLEGAVAGHDIQTGQPLWEHPWPGGSNANANVSQAWAIDENRVFVSKGYGQGCMLFAVSANSQAASPGWATELLWANARAMKTKFSNPAIWQGHVYGLDDGLLSCVELETGKRIWKKGRFGHGQLTRVGEWLLVLAEDGELALVAASPEEYREAGRCQVLEGKTWNNPCIYGDRLLVRNGEMAACYQLALEE
jgi:outer membrane protein assembly factor BamB